MNHDQIHIIGGAELHGEIPVQGAKNAALKIMAAALLSDEVCTIPNLPDIEDVRRMAELIAALGADIKTDSAGTHISGSGISSTVLPADLAGKLRASIMLAAPLLARFGEVTLPYPGGCNLGVRPIDLFLEGFTALGASVTEAEKGFSIQAPQGLIGASILLPKVSVMATESLMIAAVLAKGTTTIKNAAMEPEIPALAEYLIKNGAKIEGAGTSTIIIHGVSQIGASAFTLIPDRIEAGTFAILGLLTNSEITVTNIVPEHLESLWLHLRKAGATLDFTKNSVTTKRHHGLTSTNITTHEYPGFVTDLQAPYTALMTQATGMSLIHETIFAGRLFYTDLLASMGANVIMCDPHRVVIHGPTQLHGRFLTSPDIRAGIALILAGLAATGTTTIDNVYQIDRGYHDIVGRLQKLGANITRVSKDAL
ncbi:MAG: UDP-N-acetylglucosamine 1-carboxyvinyltransferase [Patescibacteria group bacterium]